MARPNPKEVEDRKLRYFSKFAQGDPFESVDWEKRDAFVKNSKGDTLFEQKEIHCPKSWSQTALNIAASKYFRGHIGEDSREDSILKMVSRVADRIAEWATPLVDEGSERHLHDDLTYLLLNQHFAYNSPVWFNVGTEKPQQCSACFINSIKDNMNSIMDLAKTEAKLFQGGSGAGTNLSPLRGSTEKLSGGGRASGPLSFLKGYDSFAGVVKSGGRNRRAAKMVILNIDHPDIEAFVKCKSIEEEKKRALVAAGFGGEFDGEAANSVAYQNANHSIRVNDAFMEAAANDERWELKEVVSKKTFKILPAKQLLRAIAEEAWRTGDPGLQYDSEINRMNTSSHEGRINASNPCGEYLYLDDTSCNLASHNLMKYLKKDFTFDMEGFISANELATLTMEAIVENAHYPTPEITKNSRRYRTLGVGYANLGAFLMAMGIPYDSDEGRSWAGAITSLMTATVYKTSAELARQLGPFEGYKAESMLPVIERHMAATSDHTTLVAGEVWPMALGVWKEALEIGREYGFRNGQATVLAPTGTIGFLMDCDTTGVEPDFSLVKYKNLVGGGVMKIVNNTVPLALKRLDYNETEVDRIIGHIQDNDTIEGAPYLKDEHLPVFDCANKSLKGNRYIEYRGHLRMLEAVQPFISGGISKTINMPTHATVEDILKVYFDSWKMGLKSVTVYRDGSKQSQPLVTSDKGDKVSQPKPIRRKLSDERPAITHKFRVGSHEGYITVGLFDDNLPGEVFITMSKEGSTLAGFMDSWATSLSLLLQYGVPLKDLCRKFSHVKFEPSGITGNADPRLRFANSVIDYIARWLAFKFLPHDDQPNGNGNGNSNHAAAVVADLDDEDEALLSVAPMESGDAIICSDCGAIMVQNGSCFKCFNCGTTSGCS